MSFSLVLTEEFLRKKFFKLSERIQGDTIDLLKQFPQNPHAPGYRLHKIHIHNYDVGTIWSVSLSRDYRAIIYEPDNSTTQMLLWVDNHDPAYDWLMQRDGSKLPEHQILWTVTQVDGAIGASEARDLQLRPVGFPEIVTQGTHLAREQRRLVDMNAEAPILVEGAAGTGKTTVAIHRACWLAVQVFAGQEDKILFLSYSADVARGVSHTLREMCPSVVFDRIEVDTIDRWAASRLEQLMPGFKSPVTHAKSVEKAWDRARRTSFPGGMRRWSSTWLKNEYDAIIVGHGLKTQEEYLRHPRRGRGRLSRKERKQLWNFFSAYRQALEGEGIMEREDMYRELATSIEDGLEYCAVVADEIEEMTPAALRLIRHIVPAGPNDLFLAGNPFQRIHGQPLSLSDCGIQIDGGKHTLTSNYRMLSEVHAWATARLRGTVFEDMQGHSVTLEEDGLHQRSRLDYQLFDKPQDEVQAVAAYLKNLEDDSGRSTVCLVTRTEAQLKEYKRGLEELECELTPLKPTEGNPSVSGPWMATMHQVKGLAFDHVIAMGVRKGKMPLRSADSKLQGVAKSRALRREFSLLYMVATRARKTLLITGYGKESPFLAKQ